jgi:hypothetical protein
VYRYQGLGPGCDLLLDEGRVEIISVGIDIYENWGSPYQTNSLGGGKESERRCDDFITKTYPKGS